MDEQEKLAFAQKRVEALTGFYAHLAIYVLVIVMLLLIDWGTGRGWWVQWPAMGWGIGVFFHAMAVFARVPRFVKDWQLRKIREIKDSM